MRNCFPLLLFSCIVLISASARAQQNAAVKDVTFEPLDDYSIQINYNLIGDKENEYNISVLFKRQSVSAFVLKPRALSGDFKDVVADGSRKKIIWKYVNEYTPDPDAIDYYFELTATPVSSGSTWYYYVGGAAVAGGVAAVLLLGKKTEETSAAKPSPIGAPPVRP